MTWLRFPIAFFLAFVIWLALKLTETYTLELKIPIRYQGTSLLVPDTARLPRFLEVKIKGRGSTLFLYSIGLKKPLLKVPLNRYATQREITTIQIYQQLVKLWGSQIEIIEMTPRQLPVAFIKKELKKLPVGSRVRLITSKGYWPTTLPSFEPSYVNVIADSTFFQQNNKWYTVDTAIVLSKKQMRIKVPLEHRSGIDVNPDKVTLIVKAQRYTEKCFTLPIQTRNVPEEVWLLLVPSKISLCALVPVEHYEKVKKEDFTVSVDYLLLPQDGTHVVPYVEVRIPEYVYHYYLKPSIVKRVIHRYAH